MTRPSTAIAAERRAQILALAEQQATAAEIADALDLGQRRVRQVLADAGVAPAASTRGRPPAAVQRRPPVRSYSAERDGVRVTVRAVGREAITRVEDAAGGAEAVGGWAMARLT